jgi:choline-sulfatase
MIQQVHAIPSQRRFSNRAYASLMQMRLFAILLCFAGLSSTGYAQRPGVSPVKSSDVFLITIDTLRADHLHCYGYEKIATPSLDSLADEGVRFTEAFTPSPITNTSHTTILTGLLPSSHGVMDFGIPLASTYPTAAELFRQRGYRTAAFIGAIILDSKSLAPGLDRGFDFYDNFPEHADPKSRWGRVERRGDEVVHHAEQWLAAHPQGPHFVWVHLYDPHDPYEPPPPFSTLYKDRLYDGEIAYADSALGKFLAFLKSHGWYRNALIALVGDHGEGLGEHGEDTHGIFLYDSTTHVPLVFKLPAMDGGGKVVDAQVRTTDLLPTLLDFASSGTSTPETLKFDGSSLRPYIDGTETLGRTAFGQTDYPLRFGWAPLRSVRRNNQKFIEAPRPEFYELSSDPGEKTNLYAPWNAEVQKSRELLADLRKRQPPVAPNAATVGEGTVAELKALGYLGAADAGTSTTVPEPSLLPDPKDHIEEQNLLHSALLAAEDNRPDAASAALEKTLALNPKSFAALRQLGELEMQSGNWSKAAVHLRAAHELEPQNANLNLQLGETLAKTGDWTDARDALESGLKANPGQIKDRIQLGNVYLALKDGCAATNQFEAALLLNAQSTEAKSGLAKVQATSPCQR